MANGTPRRRRNQRVTSLDLPPSRWDRFRLALRNPDVLMRIGLCLVTCIALWGLTQPWSPPFTFKEGTVTRRAITSRVEFKRKDDAAKEKLRNQERSRVSAVFNQDPQPWERMESDLHNALLAVASAMTAAEVPADVWSSFEPAEAPKDADPAAREAAIEQFRTALGGQEQVGKIDDAVKRAMTPFVERGRLDKVPNDPSFRYDAIFVQTVGQPEKRLVNINEVLFDDRAEPIRTALSKELESDIVRRRVTNFLLRRLPKVTLALNPQESQRAQDLAAEAVPDQFVTYGRGQTLVEPSQPLTAEALELLRLEHANYLQSRSWPELALRSAAVMMIVVAFCIVWVLYLAKREPHLLRDLRRFSTLLLMIVITLLLARWLSTDPYRAELIPLLLFGMTIGIAYRRELAMVLTGSVAAILLMAGRNFLGEFLVLISVSVTAILLMDHIRSRSKLIKVGVIAGVVAFSMTFAVGMLEEQDANLVLLQSLQNGLWAIVAGFLISGLLPFIESLFGVLTEISLLELGDVAHPLLQELVRRAPGTYNHSINVASLAEAAAESIGGQGLLVRVGAYFHDIGKMLKPGYFAENQGQEASRHDSLVPAMSTLIIIAHIKDGADLARQHHLPQPIIDLIEQHHGTTLVEYFYRRASELSEANPDAGEVEENAFRYPGPKPQSKEAAVLMLADAVESACRTLVEPTPARIDNLVEQITRKRLLDGQFDECNITLEEVHTVEDSLVKSLTAVYHGRVKYPDQQRTA
jgi:putative nucleotidyltransferase with HDIG domain